MTAVHAEQDLRAEIGQFYDDPLGHVLFSYPWGSGQLKDREPDKWQIEMFEELGQAVRDNGFNGIDPVEALKFSTASGHGIGKSCMVAWLIRWIMDTRPQSRGSVTANTAAQLRTKTWAELAKWHNMAITKHWWVLNAGTMNSLNMYHKDDPTNWRVDAYTCEERNSEAFAGQHSLTATSFYIFDEASAIPEVFFDVREGGLTDGEPMIFDFGNPTRNSGRFYQNMVGKYRDYYRRRFIDSRTVKITNKELFKKWEKEYGEDSDFFKVRVKGEFPSSGSMQFIPLDAVKACIGQVPWVGPQDPVVFGVDVARFGDNDSVIYIRHGRDCATHGYLKFSGVDAMTLSARIAEEAARLRPDAIFIDGGGVGGGVVDRCRQLGLDVFEINFGAKASHNNMKNMRAQCWYNMREAIKAGLSFRDDKDLISDLTGLEYSFDSANRLQLERKEDAMKRGIASPDIGDALALSFAYPVHPARAGYDGAQYARSEHDYDPFA